MLHKKGFTLIELLVVISIIAVLMAILMPALGKVREMAKITVCKTRLKNMSTATLAYAASNGDRLPIPYWQSNSQGTTSTWQSYVMKETNDYMGRNNTGNFGTEVFGFGYLWQGKYLDDPEIFVCPGIPSQDINMPFILRMLKAFDDDTVCKRVDAQYSYIPLTAKPFRNAAGQITYWPDAKKASQLSGSSAMAMDKMRSASNFVHIKGRSTNATPLINVCFGDGHIVTSDNKTFFTPAKVAELKALPGNAIIPTRDFFDFLDTMEK